MSDLRALYQDTILDHSRRPRNFGRLAHPTHHSEGYNPLCGDKVEVFLEVEGEVVRDVSFEGAGCAISTSSASLMTQAIKGKSVAEAMALFAGVRDLMMGKDGNDGGVKLGKLTVFQGVCEFPLRVKCATLAWHTLSTALAGKDDQVSTE
ncbi:MAG: SUF system NifU family Fe-S cluster assembly protein [Deltaproteobacteria bacterium]